MSHIVPWGVPTKRTWPRLHIHPADLRLLNTHTHWGKQRLYLFVGQSTSFWWLNLLSSSSKPIFCAHLLCGTGARALQTTSPRLPCWPPSSYILTKEGGGTEGTSFLFPPAGVAAGKDSWLGLQFLWQPHSLVLKSQHQLTTPIPWSKAGSTGASPLSSYILEAPSFPFWSPSARSGNCFVHPFIALVVFPFLQNQFCVLNGLYLRNKHGFCFPEWASHWFLLATFIYIKMPRMLQLYTKG